MELTNAKNMPNLVVKVDALFLSIKIARFSFVNPIGVMSKVVWEVINVATIFARVSLNMGVIVKKLSRNLDVFIASVHNVMY
jgi:hypothetical protein